MRLSELMHDWSNLKADDRIKEVYTQFGAIIGWD
jgi:hypothetical protein